MNISISNRRRARKIDLRLLKKIVVELLAELKIRDAEIEINLIGAEEMTLLNEKFLKHKGSTDVITFDYQPEDGRRKTESKICAEIFVCVDEAVLQSKKFKTSWQSEIVRYIVHGILHLIGNDDRRIAVRKKMKREENRLLRELSRRFALSKL